MRVPCEPRAWDEYTLGCGLSSCLKLVLSTLRLSAIKGTHVPGRCVVWEGV